MSQENWNAFIAAEIRRRREDAGLSRSDLAAKLGVTRNWICMMENPKRAPGLPTLIKVCEALKCDLGEFFKTLQITNGEESPTSTTTAEDCDNITQNSSTGLVVIIEIRL